MAWFSLWVPLALQLVAPLLLLVWVLRAAGDRVRRLASAGITALYLLAIVLAGLWLVLPWWLPYVYAVLLLVVATRVSARTTPQRGNVTVPGAVTRLATGLAALGLSALILVTLFARRPPGDTVDLTFPLRGGTYLVVNGGNHLWVNAHLATLEGERFRPYRGQSYGVDLVRLDRMGLRARGLLPDNPRAYAIFGQPVAAPCSGRVVVAADGAVDMPPPQPDRAHMAGNHVMLECAAIWVLLGHLQRGSLAVREGQAVLTGDVVGRVGNSGNTGEPHLHIHAQRPGSVAEPTGGEPLPIRFNGRYLVRNARVTMPSYATP
jgi:hypothetical protein